MINYEYISKAIHHYGLRGFSYLEVPWLVPEGISDMTRENKRDTSFVTRFGELVGSGEQSFLSLMVQEALAPGRYMCATPCFRNEPVLDELHRRHFFKVELIDTLTVDVPHLHVMIAKAMEFFIAHHIEVALLPTGEDEYDIVEKEYGIELGSYGIRREGNLAWIYGTGCAEPRMSHVINILRRDWGVYV